MKKIAIITARAGSKGLPDKNVLMVDGKPLSAYTIEAAIASQQFDQIVYSTDSVEYIDLLSHYPITFSRRPEHLALDGTSSYAVLEDLLVREGYADCDYFVLLQPTSPLRTELHIQAVCKLFEERYNEFDYLVSVSNAHKPTTLTRQIDEDQSLKYFNADYSGYARQKLTPEYSPNGAFFVAKPQAYLRTHMFYGERSIAYFMDKASSIDIDDRDDFEYFYFVTQQRKRESLLHQQVKQEVSLRQATFSQEADISLIGDSLLNLLPHQLLGSLRVQSLTFNAVTPRQYIEEILPRITCLAPRILIAIGRDALRRNPLIGAFSSEVSELISKIQALAPNAQIQVVECPLVSFRADVTCRQIEEYNKTLQEICTSLNLPFIPTAQHLSNCYGKLCHTLTNDGFSLNRKGYEALCSLLVPH